MKKISIFIFLIITLASCQSTDKVSQPIKIDNELVLVSNKIGNIGGISSTDTGFYQTYINDDNSGSVYYYDINTMTRVLLSDDVINQNENNTSYIPSALGGVWTISSSNNLYLVKGGSYLLGLNNENGLPSITKMDLNGANPYTYIFSNYDQLLYDNIFFADEKYLYYSIEQIDKEDIHKRTYQLVRLDFEKKKQEPVIPFDDDYKYKTVDVVDDNVLIEKYDNTNNVEVIKLNIYNLEKSVVFEYNSEKLKPIYNKEKIYYIDNTKNSFDIISYDINTKVSKSLISEYGIQYIQKVNLSSSIYDNKLEINVEDIQEETHILYYDLSTNKVIEVNIFLKDKYGEEYSADIIDETKEHFVIYMGEKAVKKTRVSQIGVLEEVTLYELQFAVIAKDDYFNSNSNFKYFEELT